MFCSTRRLAVPAVLFVATLLGAIQPDSPAKSKVQALVKEAIAFAKTNGKESLLKETNLPQGRFHVTAEQANYLFIHDGTGTCMGMGYQAGLVGSNR